MSYKVYFVKELISKKQKGKNSEEKKHIVAVRWEARNSAFADQ